MAVATKKRGLSRDAALRLVKTHFEKAHSRATEVGGRPAGAGPRKAAKAPPHVETARGEGRRVERDVGGVVREVPSIDAVGEAEKSRNYVLTMPGRVFLVGKRRWAALHSLEVREEFTPKDKVLALPLHIMRVPLVCVVDRDNRRYNCVGFDVELTGPCYAKPERCKKLRGLGAVAASPPWYLYLLPEQVEIVGTDKEYEFVRSTPDSYAGVVEPGKDTAGSPRRSGEVEVWFLEARGADLPNGSIFFSVLYTPWGPLIRFNGKYYTSGAELVKELRKYTDNEKLIEALTKGL